MSYADRDIAASKVAALLATFPPESAVPMIAALADDVRDRVVARVRLARKLRAARAARKAAA